MFKHPVTHCINDLVIQYFEIPPEGIIACAIVYSLKIV